MKDKFIASHTQQNNEFMNQNVHTNELVKELANKVEAMSMHNKIHETQVSQVSQQQAAIASLAGTFLGQSHPIPKGDTNSITLQSGTWLDGPVDLRVERHVVYERVEEAPEKVVDKSEIRKPIAEVEETITKKDDVEKEKPYVPPHLDKPKIPYPQRLAKTKKEDQFKKFIEFPNLLHVTIPFTEAITQMPLYAKLLKDILSNKRKLEDDETVALTAECNTIIQNNMPPKLKDPGSFSIPYVIGKNFIDKELCDLRASLSLMPLSICEKLYLGYLRPIRMSLQLEDHYVKYPVGML